MGAQFRNLFMAILAILVIAGCGGSSNDSESNPLATQSSTPKFLLASATVNSTSSQTSTDNPGPFAVWTYVNLLDEGVKQGFFRFAAANHINQLYFDSAKGLREQPAQLAQLIADANARGIAVTLVFGEKEWALETNHQKAVNIAISAANFTRQLQLDGKPAPVGIQFDVEPYLLAQWKTDMQGTALQYLQLLAKLRQNIVAIIPDNSFPFSVDIPFWFDNMQVLQDGQYRPLSELTIDATDSTVMMDYRNSASRIVDGATSELDYAAKVGKKMVVGMYISCPAQVDSMCGNDTMLAAAQTAGASLASKPSFGGFAVYNYESWAPGPFAVSTNANLLDESIKQDFFRFAAENRINQIYFSSGKRLTDQPTQLAQLIADARARNISITLLVGENGWALEENHQKAVDMALNAASFAQQLRSAGKPSPSAILLNVLPYLLPQWTSDMQSTAAQYLLMLQKVRQNMAAITTDGSFPIGVNIPFWYDTTQVLNNGQYRPLSELTIDTTHYTVMMDYRNTASKIVDGAVAELDYAANAGKKMVVGMQMKCPADVESLCGKSTMLDAAEFGRKALSPKSSFGGFTISNYENWVNAP